MVNAISYDLDGRRLSAAYASGVQSRYEYDAVGHFGAMAHANGNGSFYSATLAWDGVGNLTGLNSPGPALSATFAYDDMDRLTRAVTSVGDIRTYTYDTLGNLTDKSRHRGVCLRPKPRPRLA